MKKIAVWGTGKMAGKFAGCMGLEKVDCFIDNALGKHREVFMGKTVYHPSQVKDWKQWEIWISRNYYQDVKAQLENKGLQASIDFHSYGEQIKCIDEERIEQSSEAFLEQLEKRKDEFADKDCVFSDYVLSNSDYNSFLNMMNNDVDFRFAYFVNIGGATEEQVQERLLFPSIVLPIFLGLNLYPTNTDNLFLAENIKQYLLERPYLYYASENINQSYEQGIELYGELIAYYADVLLRKVFDLVSPRRVVIGCSFYPMHDIIRNICKERNVPVVFFHPGAFFGTLAFEEEGEMGESLPATRYEKFRELPVTEEELQEAQKVWDYLRESSVNRKIQLQYNANADYRKRFIPGRPIVFCAGQNDFCTGIKPNTSRTAQFHSPIFKSSIDSAVCLAKICEKNNWNLIYKPHPMANEKEQYHKLPENVILVEAANINELIDVADVTVTIVSQTAYVALTRYKPVVMLGYTQLRGKNCTYEAFEAERIEEALRSAIEEGFTQGQQEAFRKHTAQLLKYYLYDDLSDKPFKYGKTLPKSWEEVEALKNLLQ